MKNIILLLAFVIGGFQANAQITYRACEGAVLGAQDYIFTQNGTTNDAGTIRNTFETLAADFTQSCPAGVCELRIMWNIAMARWEVQLDNDGPLATPDYTTAVLFYNTNASEPNPPSLVLGGWIDNLGGACGGDDSFTTLAGDVQDVVLGINDVDLIDEEITMFPNPAKDLLSIESSVHSIKSVSVYSLLGKKVLDVNSDFNQIDLTTLSSKMYLVKIETTDRVVLVKKLMVD